MKMKTLLITALAILGLLLFVSCSGVPPEEALLGTWECQDAPSTHVYWCRLVITEDGRFIDYYGDAGYWSVDGNELTLLYDDEDEITITFRVHGTRLTLTFPELSLVLRRQ